MSANGHGPMQQAAPENVTNELLSAVGVMAGKVKMASVPEDAKDLAMAALSLAQTLVILDPTRGPNGVPLDHEKQLEQMKSRASAEAPSPKKKITVNRGPDGRASSYEAEG